LNRKWMPVTAGILDVICGISGILAGLFFLAIGATLGSGSNSYPPYQLEAGLMITSGIIALAGGVFSFLRKRWALTFTGAIAALLASVPWVAIPWVDFKMEHLSNSIMLFNLTVIPGIVAIILTVLSRKQFERK